MEVPGGGKRGQKRAEGSAVAPGKDGGLRLLDAHDDPSCEGGVHRAFGRGAVKPAPPGGEEIGQRFFPGPQIGGAGGGGFGPCQRDDPTPRDKGGEEPFALRGEEQEADAGTRLLQRFQEGVGGFHAERLGLSKDDHTFALPARGFSEDGAQFADGFDFD